MNRAGALPVSVLLITGTVGVGKSALAREVGELLRRSGMAGAMIDLDALSYACSGPVEDRFNSDLVLRNLKAIWPNYAERGVDHLVLARYVAAATELDGYRDAIPSATLVVCRVTAPAETVRERLRRREVGLERDFLLALSETLAADVDARVVEDLLVENGPHRSITDVAEEVVTRLGWIVGPSTSLGGVDPRESGSPAT